MRQPPHANLQSAPKPVSPVARALGERRLAVQRGFFDTVVLPKPAPAALARWHPGRLARLWVRGFAQAWPTTVLFTQFAASAAMVFWPTIHPSPVAWINTVCGITGCLLMLDCTSALLENFNGITLRLARLAFACRDNLLAHIQHPPNLIALCRDRSEQYSTRALQEWTRAQDAVHAGQPRRAAYHFEACMRLAIAAGDDFRVVEDCGMLAGLSAYMGHAPRLAASLLCRNAHSFSMHNAPYAALRARLLAALCAADRTPDAIMTAWNSMRLRIDIKDFGAYLTHLLQHLGCQHNDAVALFDQFAWLQRLPSAKGG